MAGIHFWYPKMFGRMYPQFLAKLSAIVIFFGFNFTFFPQFILGYLGMPRRYHSYPPEWQVYNVLSTAGATLLGLGFLLAIGYLYWGIWVGQGSRAQSLGRQGPRMGTHHVAPRRTQFS